jgi:hypothetical protein
MAITQVYTAVPNDVITAARWNNEFGNIYNNGTVVAFPLTQAVSFAGFTITLDNAGNTTLVSSSTTALNLTPGTKTGTPGTTGNIINIAANTFTDTNTAGSGTAAAFVATAFQRPTLAATNATVTTTDAATVYIANAPLAGTNETITNQWSFWADNGNVRVDAGIISPTFRGEITGLTYANSAVDAVNDITIAVGAASDSTTAYPLILASSITKQLDVNWAVGDNAGGLDTGSIGNSDYYIWLIARSDTGVVDALYSLSSTAPTMPTSYNYKRLIGWFKRVGATIVVFNTYELAGGGLELLWSVLLNDVSLSNTLTTSRRTDAVRVPLNFSVVSILGVTVIDATTGQVAIVYCPDQADAVPATAGANINSTSTNGGVELMYVRTSSAGLVAARSNLATVDTYIISTIGFDWARR